MRVRLRTAVYSAAFVLWPVIASAQAADKAAEKPGKKLPLTPPYQLLPIYQR